MLDIGPDLPTPFAYRSMGQDRPIRYPCRALHPSQLKNIAELIRIYSLQVGSAAKAKATTQNKLAPVATLDP